jgi:site-specific recombinase XerD
MAQNNTVAIPVLRYTRADFTALRASLNRLPIARIAELYYSEDDLLTLACNTGEALRQRLDDLRDTLVQRSADSNPHLAETLRAARQVGRWSARLIDFLVHAADADMTTPQQHDAVSMWFKPRVAVLLKAEGARTLAELMALIETRGIGWWKPIPRIGARKAASLERWLRRQEASLGFLKELTSPVTSDAVIELSPDRPVMLPLERIALPANLDGRHGTNRATAFCLIFARNDLEAIDAYLYKFRAQETTRRAYQRELERFLLWCIYERAKPLSSVLQEDCEAFKDFVSDPPPPWVGPRTGRLTAQWRPFAGRLTAKSQRYAVQAIRSFFTWLVNVRYLGGNPWMTVADPRVATEIQILQIDKALPEDLWIKLAGPGGLLDQLCATPDPVLRVRYRLRGSAAAISMAAQFRIVRAAILLLGNGGLRREEAARATRARLKPVAGMPDLWELDVLGKRNKWRTVFLPGRVAEALQAHWADRGQDFSFGLADLPLLSPLVVPSTASAQARQGTDQGRLKEVGFSAEGLYQVIKSALRRMADDDCLDVEDADRERLRNAAPHAFRHTFGTQAAAQAVPLDVLQRVLGHASLQTTTIYVQAEKKRSIAEMGKFFSH